MNRGLFGAWKREKSRSRVRRTETIESVQGIGKREEENLSLFFRLDPPMQWVVFLTFRVVSITDEPYSALPRGFQRICKAKRKDEGPHGRVGRCVYPLPLILVVLVVVVWNVCRPDLALPRPRKDYYYTYMRTRSNLFSICHM